ncbi:uncharacterized protein N7500_006283 [Penicillium coprophilum]|uniref:uncharacterized protein n=1 Tax=Penicillium coprophilum TaxID=36646 RepID=UPI0023A44111|nr:uncharacterized protein N7500_006283 [Penicillium coprophilum]KAJ5164453.1 hypothetical protein N7500_006283 [Penicillium coprophilum]
MEHARQGARSGDDHDWVVAIRVWGHVSLNKRKARMFDNDVFGYLHVPASSSQILYVGEYIAPDDELDPLAAPAPLPSRSLPGLARYLGIRIVAPYFGASLGDPLNLYWAALSLELCGIPYDH